MTDSALHAQNLASLPAIPEHEPHDRDADNAVDNALPDAIYFSKPYVRQWAISLKWKICTSIYAAIALAPKR